MDQCIFYKKGIIVLIYVEDLIIIASSEPDIKKFVTTMGLFSPTKHIYKTMRTIFN